MTPEERIKQREYRKRRYEQDPEEIKRQRREAARRHRAKHAEKFKKYCHEYYCANKARYTATQRLLYTGWTQEQYDAALLKQGGVCSICGAAPGKKGLMADHCHHTGRIRELLCVGCNSWIGQYEKDLDRTQKRIDYINRYSNVD